MIDTEIEKILKIYFEPDDPDDIIAAKVVLSQLFKDEWLKLIGDDEYTGAFGIMSHDQMVAWDRNQLREELRTAINKPILTSSEKRQMKNNNVSITKLKK